MALLMFAATNHRSLRDRAELDLRTPALTGTRPPAGSTWPAMAYPIASIFGANASGKTALIDALHYAIVAVRASAREWLGASDMPRAPFGLEAATRAGASAYEFDFVLGDTRYRYSFSVDPAGVADEHLRAAVGTRWRELYARGRVSGETRLTLGRGIRMIEVAPRELVLSRALVVDHANLAHIASGLSDLLDVLPLGETYRHDRINAVAEDLAAGRVTFEEVTTLLRAADTGISAVSIREDRMPKRVRELMLAFMSAREKTVAPDADDDEDTLDIPEFMRSLEFTHRGTDPTAPPLRLANESAGTIAWLALAVPVIRALRRGSVIVVDELDSSLHPHLFETLVGAFADPSVNTRGAQLICTCHDSYLLTNLSDVELAPGQVWFTEKGRDGATTLFSLADFPRHPDDNRARRYLLGRYGAVPHPSPSLIAALVLEDAEAV